MVLRVINRISANQIHHLLRSVQVTRSNCYRHVHRVTSACVLSNPSNLVKQESPPSGIISKDLMLVPSAPIFARNFCTRRPFDDEFEEEPSGLSDEAALDIPLNHSLPVSMVVPEEWPHVPLIAINRSPVFPRFIKLLEVDGLNNSSILLSFSH